MLCFFLLFFKQIIVDLRPRYCYIVYKYFMRIFVILGTNNIQSGLNGRLKHGNNENMAEGSDDKSRLYL